MAPALSDDISTAELLSYRARQLQKRKADLAVAAKKVIASRFRSAAAFARAHAHVIKDYQFLPGDLVLYRNTKVEKEASRKHKPRYLGPMRVVRRTTGGAYILAELDGAESKTRYAAFRVIPYYARDGDARVTRDDDGKDMESGDRDGDVAGEKGSDDSEGEGDAFAGDGDDILL